MHLKVFSTAQARHIAQALYEYWHNSRAMFRTRSLQILSQLHARQTEGFRDYVAELVRSSLLGMLHTLTTPLARNANSF